MWAKIGVVSSHQHTIFLPASLARSCRPAMMVNYGGKSASASIQSKDDLVLMKENTFENPGRIMLSDKLKDELLIEESLIYQIIISDNAVNIGPVIGLLLGNDTNRYSPKHMRKYSDRFGVYHQVGGLIYAFSPKLINWDQNLVYGLGYRHITESWEYGCFPLPEVIYRRDFHTDPAIIHKLSQLTKGRLFNSYRFSKEEFYDFIQLNPELKPYLPPTEFSLEFHQVRKFIGSHLNVILKPVHLSRGRGICIIEKINQWYKITDYRSKTPIVSELSDDDSLKNFLVSSQAQFTKYLIQKYLSLAKIGDSIFDIRVVMQKQKDQQWGCSGIECRVSNKNSHLTNIARGGYPLPLEEALCQAFGRDSEILAMQIHKLCLTLCLYLDTAGEHFAEFGLDVAIDINKKLWLIEANVFPSFKGFKKMSWPTYLSIRYNPLLYACSLTQFGG